MNELDIPLFRSAAGQRSFLFRAVGLWSGLPKFLARIESVPRFKTKVKKQFLETFFVVFNQVQFTFVKLAENQRSF